MNMFGIEASSRHDLLDLRDRHSAGSRHVGIEVTSGLSIDEISFRISLPRLDDREVSRQRRLTDEELSVELLYWFSFRHDRADADPRVESADARATGPDAPGQRSLWTSPQHRTRAVQGKSVSVRVDLGGRS